MLGGDSTWKNTKLHYTEHVTYGAGIYICFFGILPFTTKQTKITHDGTGM